MLYQIIFALRLWSCVPGMPLRVAFFYPCDRSIGNGDPIEDADTEISYMAEA